MGGRYSLGSEVEEIPPICGSHVLELGAGGIRPTRPAAFRPMATATHYSRSTRVLPPSLFRVAGGDATHEEWPLEGSAGHSSC